MNLLLLPTLLLGAALAQAPTTTHLLDALKPATRQQFELALTKERAGELRRAEAGYMLVLRREPGVVPAVMGLGRVRAALGDVEGAMEAYESLPAEADAVEALADLLADTDPVRSAGLYQTLLSLRPGTAEPYGPLAITLARAGELDAAQEALDMWVALSPGDVSAEVFITLAVAFRAAGRESEAVALLERALDVEPDGPMAAEVRGRLDRIAVEQAARMLGLGGAERLPPSLRRDLEQAGSEAAAGELESARVRLEEVVREAPRSPEARAALADVLLAQGEVAAAERALAWAVSLEPDQSEWHARLGGLLADSYGGRRHGEAASELRRALSLRPGWPSVQLRLGIVLQEQGDWTGALEALRACARLESQGPNGMEARRRIADLTRDAPEPPDVDIVAGPPVDVPAAALKGYRIARVYLDRGDTVRARAELVPVQKLAPDWPAVLNLEAALFLREGNEEAATESWRRSLLVEPAQPRVKVVLGELARRGGDRDLAIQLLTEAAREGAPDAHYPLAAMAFEEHRIFDARDALDAFLAGNAGGLNHQPALQLRRTVERRIRVLQFGVGGGSALLVFGILGLLVWRRSAHPLEVLIGSAPDAAHDLARILSAIRHEVLKHNTTLLGEVAYALEHGDHHVVAFAAGRLYGTPGDPRGGVVARFEADLAAIQRIGQQHGVRLDLRRRDPVLGPMWAAMQRLRRLEPDLRRPETARRGTGEELRQLAVELNETAYAALGRMVRRLGTLSITVEHLEAVTERVRREPGFAGRALPEVELAGPPAGVPARVLSGDLDDVVANLVRNAWKAGATRTGIHLVEEDDPITGLEDVALRFLDDAPGELTDSMIQQRGIGRGLGLVVDLVTRHDGSISVENPEHERADGWTKAVVVRFTRAETDEEQT